MHDTDRDIAIAYRTASDTDLEAQLRVIPHAIYWPT